RCRVKGRWPGGHSGTDRSAAPGLATELRDQPIAVAAVDRADVLDDLAGLRARRPLEQEGGRVEWDTEHVGLLLVRHRGLDRLQPADDVEPVALAEELVEGVTLEV